MIRRSTRFATGLLSLGAHLGGQVVTLSRDVHASVRDSVHATLGSRAATAYADGVYGLVRGTFDLAGNGLAGLAQVIGDDNDDESERILTVTAAVNGVFGDLLEARQNPLALEMQLRRPAPRDDAACNLLFIHGLCMHDRQWLQGAHPSFVEWAHEHLAAEPMYLRYNSGRHISQNATDLAALLEHFCATESDRKLVIVGHSMGGLLTRGALQAAKDRKMNWPSQLEAFVALGSPHQGAGLEQLGNFANRQLRILPWSAPFTRLGNLRSAGIRDLRYGNLRDTDWQGHDDIEHTEDLRTPVATPAGIRHLFVAATRTNSEQPEQEKSLAGDLLVGVDSALAKGYPGTEKVDRRIIPALDHMGLLWDGRVYDHLRDWLANAS